MALLPIRPAWLWFVSLLLVAALPWLLALVRRKRPAPYWRLSPDGLERIGPEGADPLRYERGRIEELAITAADGILTIFHKFGRTEVGKLTGLGFEPFTFFVSARRIGIPIHVLDGTTASLDSDDTPPPGKNAERRLLDLEAELLSAVHAPGEPRGEPVRLTGAAPEPGRGRTIALGVLLAAAALLMIARIALTDHVEFGDRVAAGAWALVAVAAAHLTRRRLIRAAPVSMTVTAETLSAGSRALGRQDVPGGSVAAVMVGPGPRFDPLTGRPKADALCVLAFDHRMRLLAQLPAHGLDSFQVTHALDEHGYQVITTGARTLRPSEYGLDGLPEIFSQVPGGRLVVVEDGLGWADAAGDVVLRMPGDRIGGLELLTIHGHAWLRVYDSDGDEFFAAPLSVLRISRTDLRDSARRVGLPINDAEYDAYMAAAFHGAVSGIAADAPARPEVSATPVTVPPGPGILLDVTRRSRLLSYVVTLGLCLVVAVLGAVWVGDELGGFWTTMAWAVPLGGLMGLGGAWLYDRDRTQLRLSSTGVAAITRLGRTQWDLRRESIGGVGVDESEDGPPRLVVWGPSGRVLRRVVFPPDLGQVRRACERYGLPWGPPDAGLPTPPPPEL